MRLTCLRVALNGGYPEHNGTDRCSLACNAKFSVTSGSFSFGLSPLPVLLPDPEVLMASVPPEALPRSKSLTDAASFLTSASPSLVSARSVPLNARRLTVAAAEAAAAEVAMPRPPSIPTADAAASDGSAAASGHNLAIVTADDVTPTLVAGVASALSSVPVTSNPPPGVSANVSTATAASPSIVTVDVAAPSSATSVVPTAIAGLLGAPPAVVVSSSSARRASLVSPRRASGFGAFLPLPSTAVASVPANPPSSLGLTLASAAAAPTVLAADGRSLEALPMGHMTSSASTDALHRSRRATITAAGGASSTSAAGPNLRITTSETDDHDAAAQARQAPIVPMSPMASSRVSAAVAGPLPPHQPPAGAGLESLLDLARDKERSVQAAEEDELFK